MAQTSTGAHRVVDISPRLPGNTGRRDAELGPDATGVGWVFQYALVDHSGKHNLAELRSYQDWNLRYALQSVPGVAEVAGLGGFQKQYQVTVYPVKLQASGLPVLDVMAAIRKNNNEVGGRTISGTVKNSWSGPAATFKTSGRWGLLV